MRTELIQLFTTSVLACVGLFATFAAQTSSDQSSKMAWSYNFSDSPLVITTIGTKIYNLKNISTQSVSGYRMACVSVLYDKTPKIVHTMPFQVAKIEPGASMERIALHSLPEKIDCDERMSRLTVVFVKLGNTKWHAVHKQSFISKGPGSKVRAPCVSTQRPTRLSRESWSRAS